MNSCPSKKERSGGKRDGKGNSKSILVVTEELCSFGCGQKANFQLKNGKLCCSESINSCLNIRFKIIKTKNTSLELENINHKLCDYGCGQEGKYKFKNGKWCCSKLFHSCSGIKRKNSLINNSLIIREKPELCEYGCGQKAEFYFKTPDKWCCSEHTNKCPSVKDILHTKKTKPILIETEELCFYGCGQKAKYKFKNGKLCCSDNPKKCIEVQKNTDQTWNNSSYEERYGNDGAIIQKNNLSLKMTELWDDPNSIFNSEEYLEKLRIPRGPFELSMGYERAKIRKEKLSISTTRIMSIPENRNKISGLNNYKGGKTHKEYFGEEKAKEIAEKIGISFRNKTYEEIMEDVNKATLRKEQHRINLLDRNHPIHSIESLMKRSGENHPFWNPNREEVFSPYTEKFYDNEFRKQIRIEQFDICPICQKDLCNYRITLHHIDYNKKNDCRENLMIVHNGCNVKVNYNREEWKTKLKIVNEKICIK